MASLVLLLSIAASASALPRVEIFDNRLKSVDEDGAIARSMERSRNTFDKLIETAYDSSDSEKMEEQETSESSTWLSAESFDGQLTTDSRMTTSKSTDLEHADEEGSETGSKSKNTKNNRKNKALFIDYPFLRRIPSYPNYDASDEDFDTEARTPGASGSGNAVADKKYHESNIYYIRLPPTPYMFVPGLGYISQPPTYSTPALRPAAINPYRPHHDYHSQLNDVNPFINLPLDFVSNGKPTSVYQWQSSPSYNSLKRPDSHVTTLDKGPYFFNGRPHSIYLLRPDATPVHQALRYPDYQDSSYY